jgi:hypothetical protein
MIQNALHNLVVGILVVAGVVIIVALARPAAPVSREISMKLERLEMLEVMLIRLDGHVGKLEQELRAGRNPPEVANELQIISGIIHSRFERAYLDPID